MLKIVLDANVFISSLLETGPSKVILDLWIDEKFILVTSPKLILELINALKKPKLTNRISPSDIESLLTLIQEDAMIVTPTQTINASRDAKDNKVLECAIQAKANIIGTGDKDLLVLHPYAGIDILPPSKLLARIS